MSGVALTVVCNLIQKQHHSHRCHDTVFERDKSVQELKKEMSELRKLRQTSSRKELSEYQVTQPDLYRKRSTLTKTRCCLLTPQIILQITLCLLHSHEQSRSSASLRRREIRESIGMRTLGNVSVRRSQLFIVIW